MYSLLFFLSLLTLSSWSTASDPEDNRDYYQILGVSKTATQREITKAFRKLALQYHPDKNKSPEAETEFRKIAAAYEVLSKEESRKKYDMLGHHAYTKGGAGGESSFDMHDFFRGFDFFRHHGHDDGSHRGGFRFNFGDLFGDDDDIFGGDHSYSFSEEVRHGHRAGGQRCETRTIRRGNTVITQTHCS